jgi:diguanylate cyclase (GGDEF)-like protein
VLERTAQIISDSFFECLVARLGGDEFAVLNCEDLSEDEIRIRSDKLVKSIEDEFGDLKLGVSISVGIAHTDGNLEDIDGFIHESDKRMYEEKQKKKQKN